MIRVIDAHDVVIGEAKYYEFAGLSTDTKPEYEDMATGSVFLEADTGKAYLWDEDGQNWNEMG